jgi:AcrR family transcriptional regulator
MLPTTITPPKQAILDAAQDLFAQHGYEGLSIRDLADRCGLAKATIYHHFADKQALFLSVLERDTQLVHDRLLEAAASEQNPPAKLRAVIYTYCTLMSERRSILLCTLREIGGIEAHIREFISQRRASILGPVVTILAEGMAAGLFRPLDPEMTALSLIGMVHAFITFRLLLDNVQIGSDVAEHIYALFLHGIVQENS